MSLNFILPNFYIIHFQDIQMPKYYNWEYFTFAIDNNITYLMKN